MHQIKNIIEPAPINNQSVHKACFMYGFITLIYLLSHLEQQERFEECKQLIDGMHQVNNKYDLGFEQMHFCDEAIAQHQASMLIIAGVLDDSRIINNLAEYAEKACEVLNINYASR